MPGGDRTGPMGLGPMTGRAAGYCAGFGVPGTANSLPGRGYGGGFWGGGRGLGWGRGRGGGRGRRGWLYGAGFTGWPVAAVRGTAIPAAPWTTGPYAQPYVQPYVPAATREQEIEALKGQAEYFEDILDGLRRRIEELESKTAQA